ncbi:MAG: hypothetical protein ACYDAK_03715 [Candidatus Limnocylindrales bacterium]
MMHTGVRILIGVVAGVMLLGGLVFILGGGSPGVGIELVVLGGAGILAVTLERGRYRSEHAERTAAPAGPGGGETDGALEPRFQRTGEAFVDPTTGRRMRVWLDPGTGERRYRTED